MTEAETCRAARVPLPSEDEAAQVTRENPKGRLYAFCARARCGRSKMTLARQGTAHGVELRLAVHGQTFASGMHWGAARAIAEQLAARALLVELAASEEEGEPGEAITAEEAARLRAENPKGALLELCVASRLTPVFHVRPIVVGGVPSFEGSALVTLAEEREVWSDLRRGADAKTVEQAAARSLLERLRVELASEAVSSPSPVADELEARSALNELRQRGRLQTYGFVVERMDGPPHAPVFRMTGYAVRANGERLLASAIGAASKREGEKRLAVRLLELVRTHRPRVP